MTRLLHNLHHTVMSVVSAGKKTTTLLTDLLLTLFITKRIVSNDTTLPIRMSHLEAVSIYTIPVRK